MDLRVRLGPDEYAFEHTRIEPFPHHFKTGNRFSQLVRPIELALAGMLPGPAYFELRFPLDPSLQVSDPRFAEQVSALIECIRSEAEPLYRRSVAAYDSGSMLRHRQASVAIRTTPCPRLGLTR